MFRFLRNAINSMVPGSGTEPRPSYRPPANYNTTPWRSDDTDRRTGQTWMDERLVELETKISFQEDTLQELSEIIIKQQRQLDELTRRMAALQSRLEETHSRQSGMSDNAAGTEKPPHY